MATALGPETWAVKYGATADGKFGNKSGFTPTEYALPTLAQSLDPETERIEKFQRSKLYEFTSRELGQLDCLPTRELAPGNLQNGVMPILRRENWERAPAQPDFTRDHLYPLKNGNGMWSADNDVVWKVIEPIARLASRMLRSIHMVPWFDALLKGEQRPIPDHRLHPGDKNKTDLRSFHTRPSFTQDWLACDRDFAFERLRTEFRLKYGFMVTSESPEGPEKVAEEAHAITVTNIDYMLFDPEPNKSWRVCVFIDLSQPEMLLRDGLNSAERMTIEWSIANTIVHETIHAVSLLSMDLNNRPDLGDPYFEDEAVAELGFSFEAAMNSGIPEHFLYDSKLPNPPLGYWLRRHWPTYCDIFARDPDSAILTSPGPLPYNEMFPIPISFYQDIQQEEFWSVVVRQFGNKVFHYRALKYGSRVNYKVIDAAQGNYKDRDPTRITELNSFKTLNGQFMASLEGLKAALSMTPDERKALQFGQAFLISSQLEEAFWNDSRQQEISIQLIADKITDATNGINTPERVRRVFISILTFTQQAIANHERMIARIFSLENTNGLTYTDRRANLLVWNRGTRAFIRKLIEADAQGNLNLDADRLRMEQCRMALWNPSDMTTQTGNEFLEIQILQHARQALNTGDINQCRDFCTRLLREDWRSLFAEYAAKSILFTLDQDVYEGWSERYSGLQKALITLGSMKAFAPDYWKDDVMALGTEVTALIALQKPPTPMQFFSPESDLDTASNGSQSAEGGVAPPVEQDDDTQMTDHSFPKSDLPTVSVDDTDMGGQLQSFETRRFLKE